MKSVADLILDLAADKDHQEDITLLPLMCGTGKSTAISELIGRIIQLANETQKGILIITDRIDRLNDYLSPKDPDLCEYLNAHSDEITIITQDNVRQAVIQMKKSPVLMMTTQRFINQTPKSIESFMKWGDSGERSMVLIDERPELLTEISLNDLAMSECEAALRETSIDTSFVELWHRCFLTINKLLKSVLVSPDVSDFRYNIELLHKGIGSIKDTAYFFCSPRREGDPLNIDEQLKTFRNRLSDINLFSPKHGFMNIYSRLVALLKMYEDNGLYARYARTVFQEGPDYMTSISILVDNYEVFKALNAKTIILDGTGKISPEYELHPFHIYDPPAEYQRDLSHLKIRVVNCPTSKGRYGDRDLRHQIVAIVQAYLDAYDLHDPDLALFTYMFMEREFQRFLNEDRVEHFGDIVGKNQFRNARNILQIGINRFPDPVYFHYFLAFHPEIRAEFSNALADRLAQYDKRDETDNTTMDAEALEEGEWKPDETETLNAMLEQTEKISKIMEEQQGETRRIMLRMMVAELEQNIFRGLIRNSDIDQDYTYHLFLNCKKYKDLIQMVRERYEPLGAEITITQLPPAAKVVQRLHRKGYAGKETYEQRIIRWHDETLKDGEAYTPAGIREVCGIKSIKMYEQMLRRSPYLKEKLKEELKGKGKYMRIGRWFKPGMDKEPDTAPPDAEMGFSNGPAEGGQEASSEQQQ